MANINTRIEQVMDSTVDARADAILENRMQTVEYLDTCVLLTFGF